MLQYPRKALIGSIDFTPATFKDATQGIMEAIKNNKEVAPAFISPMCTTSH